MGNYAYVFYIACKIFPYTSKRTKVPGHSNSLLLGSLVSEPLNTGSNDGNISEVVSITIHCNEKN
jgi:hypothetical protein